MRILVFFLLVLVPGLALAEDKKEKKPAYFGVQIAKAKDDKFIVVQMVLNDSPAYKGGLRGGDLLLRINDVKPETLQATVNLIKSLEPGKKVTVLIQRDGKEKKLEIIPEAIGE